MIENGLCSGLFFIICNQVMRQLLPNSFVYLWQNYFFCLVPKSLRRLPFFYDPKSLFFVTNEQYKFKRYVIFNHQNMRNIVIYFSLCFYLVTTYNLPDLEVIITFSFRIIVMLSLMSSTAVFILQCGKNNYKPDIFAITLLNFISFYVSASIAFLTLKI